MIVQNTSSPWYKNFWVWIIILLPLSVVIAGFFTLYLAISNPAHEVKTHHDQKSIKVLYQQKEHD